MKKLKFLGLLSLVTINILFAEEYISDEYFSEVTAQAEIMSESIESLPIAKTIEEEARDTEFKAEQARKEEQKLLKEKPLPPAVEASIKIPKQEEHKAVNVAKERQSIQADAYVKALEQAKDEKKVMMFSIRSTDCKYCDEMEEGTLSDSSVKDAIEDDFININYNQDIDTLPLGLQNGATPMFIFVNTKEDILNMYPGIRTPKQFKEVLEQILKM